MLVGCLVGIVGCFDGIVVATLVVFVSPDEGLFVVGTKRFQAGCNVGSLVGDDDDGEGDGSLVVGRKRFQAGFNVIVGVFVVG